MKNLVWRTWILADFRIFVMKFIQTLKKCLTNMCESWKTSDNFSNKCDVWKAPVHFQGTNNRKSVENWRSCKTIFPYLNCLQFFLFINFYRTDLELVLITTLFMFIKGIKFPVKKLPQIVIEIKFYFLLLMK